MFAEISNYEQNEHLIAGLKYNILCNVEQSQRRVPVIRVVLVPQMSAVARERLVQFYSTQQSIQIQYYQVHSD